MDGTVVKQYNPTRVREPPLVPVRQPTTQTDLATFHKPTKT